MPLSPRSSHTPLSCHYRHCHLVEWHVVMAAGYKYRQPPHTHRTESACTAAAAPSLDVQPYHCSRINTTASCLLNRHSALGRCRVRYDNGYRYQLPHAYAPAPHTITDDCWSHHNMPPRYGMNPPRNHSHKRPLISSSLAQQWWHQLTRLANHLPGRAATMRYEATTTLPSNK
jgi:hypothetical protein